MMRHFHLGCQEEWRTHEHAPAFSHIMRSSLCILRPDTVSVPMKSPVFSARAAWARCSARETHGDRDGPQDPYMKTVADAGPEQPFYRSPVLFKNPNSWSPNGKWIVLSQLCAVLPEPGHKLAVSTEGASSCRWTSDGRALPFLGADRTRLWRAEVGAGDTLRVGVPKVIGTIPANTIAADAMPDGRRILAIVPDREGPGSVTVVQNWSAALLPKNAKE